MCFESLCTIKLEQYCHYYCEWRWVSNSICLTIRDRLAWYLWRDGKILNYMFCENRFYYEMIIFESFNLVIVVFRRFLSIDKYETTFNICFILTNNKSATCFPCHTISKIKISINVTKFQAKNQQWKFSKEFIQIKSCNMTI